MNPLFGESRSFSQATRPQPQAQTPQQTPWELARMLRTMSPRQAEEQARRICAERGMTDQQLGEIVRQAKGLASALGLK